MNRKTVPRAKPTIGLLANGAAGSWDIAVDETSAGQQRWFLQIDGPWYLYIELAKLALVQEMLEYLKRQLTSGDADIRRNSSAPPELEVDNRGRISLTLLWDVEHGDRCTFLIQGPNQFCTRVSIAGDDLRDFVKALQQVADELNDDGALAEAC